MRVSGSLPCIDQSLQKHSIKWLMKTQCITFQQLIYWHTIIMSEIR